MLLPTLPPCPYPPPLSPLCTLTLHLPLLGPPSLPAGTTVASVTTIKTQAGTDGCGLAGEYEIKAASKCSSWKTATPTMQLAFEVAGVSALAASNSGGWS